MELRVVEMGAGAQTRIPRPSDHLICLDILADTDIESVEVSVDADISSAMVDDHPPTIAHAVIGRILPVSGNDSSRSRRPDLRTNRHSNIDATVRRAGLAGPRISSPAKSG
jgi:hypothetical protein